MALRGLLDSLLANERPVTPTLEPAPNQTEPDSAATEQLKLKNTPGPLKLKVGETVTVPLELGIKPGLHVQANPAGLKTLIPLQVRLNSAPRLRVDNPVYPPGHTFHLPGSDFDLLVYSDSVRVDLPLTALAGAAGEQFAVDGYIIYQSCDERMCFSPDSLSFSLSVSVER
ncbi:MAG TPA: protein-disulfide reductase DsbD domain-containing protein [candidate division Zixibacteria bacterium]|nr:protein-disulfide reductase DsbD domain-containing protein [candidate division Zixibacteria bacterium]